MTPLPARSQGLDLFKTLLVVGMVTAHVLQLLTRQLPDWTERFSEFINLVTFSGFLFAMGIGVGLSRTGPRSWWQRLRPVLMLLGAAWISALAFALLVDRLPLSGGLVFVVVTFTRLFGWSEFLATFLVLYALIALARPVLLHIAGNGWLLLAAGTLCLSGTWLIVDQAWPLVATLFSTTRFPNFPLLVYLPWFLFGVALGRAGGKLTIWQWLLAAAASLWLIYGLMETGRLPERFPPTILWIVGPALAILIYWQASSLIAGRVRLPEWAVLPGRHVLSFLLVSNLAMFTVRNLWDKPLLAVWSWLAVAVALLVSIGGAWLLYDRLRRRAGAAGSA